MSETADSALARATTCPNEFVEFPPGGADIGPVSNFRSCRCIAGLFITAHTRLRSGNRLRTHGQGPDSPQSVSAGKGIGQCGINHQLLRFALLAGLPRIEDLPGRAAD